MIIQDFDQFSSFVESSFGIKLSAYKERQMQRRILNLIEKSGASDYTQYVKLLENTDERERFLQYLTINVTDFYRNPEIFSIFEKYMVSIANENNGNLHVWSAACSIGSEPYTLAMILNKHNITKAKITATDLDKVVLQKAKSGIYTKQELRNVNSDDLKTDFNETNDGNYEIKSEFKNCITFKQHDLLKDQYEKNCQIIVCRNVTIYFKPDARDEVYQKFSDALVPGGILFTGATETINFPDKFNLKKIDNFIYQKVK